MDTAALFTRYLFCGKDSSECDDCKAAKAAQCQCGHSLIKHNNLDNCLVMTCLCSKFEHQPDSI